MRGLFCFLSKLRNGIRKLLGEDFLPVIRLQGFSWYDFSSFDNSSSAKLGQWGKSIRQKKEHVFATSRCSSWRRSERYCGRGSLCGSKNDIRESAHNKIREGASLEEQARSASCPSLADTLVPLFKPCRTRKLRQNHTAENSRHPHKSKKKSPTELPGCHLFCFWK